MARKFTLNFTGFVFFFLWIFLLNPPVINAQICPQPQGLSVTNISNFTVTTNWQTNSGVDSYRLRYKIVGASSWSYEHGINGSLNQLDLHGLIEDTNYIWQLKSFCISSNSSWSAIDSFQTANFSLDCNGTPNGTAWLDSCGNCVEGTTNKLPCIAFSPSVSLSLSSTICNDSVSMTFATSQDPNEPDMSSAVFSSNSGSFNLANLNTNDTIGYSNITAGGGYINVNTTLLVDFIISSSKISVKAMDDSTNQVYGTFTIENLAPSGILIVTTSPPDNNN
ncbi:MAG: hypothetical protein CMD06_01585, partial [Flavobacteriales bacterium]|nr:hypothetical protein [Flavobacteriales bacterium]